MLDLSSSRVIHVLGASGPGMSALARILEGMGHRVSGCDTRDSAALRNLETDGVVISVGNNVAHVRDIDAITYSSAIASSHPELLAATAAGVTSVVRGDMLAAICARRSAIGVAGTHGKTTTSAMLATILRECGYDPGFVIGGDVPGLGANAYWGSGHYLVVEADESDSTHVGLPLAGAIVTNIDVDHLDHFGSFAHLVESFSQFVSAVSGPVVLCAEDETCASLALQVQSTTFGIDTGDVRAVHVRLGHDGAEFEVQTGGETCGVRIAQRGRHNVLNALAAMAMAMQLGLSLGQAARGLASFTGVRRRFDVRGEVGGITFVDDYAHLPAEIAAVLSAVRTGRDSGSRVVAVFQPNRFQRIAQMASAYGDCFTDADLVVITDIYASGTAAIDGVTGYLIVDAVREAAPHTQIEWCEGRQELAAVVNALLRPGDVCISMGCGDIETLPDEIFGLRGETP